MVAVAAEPPGVGSLAVKDIVQQAHQPLGEDFSRNSGVETRYSLGLVVA